MGFRTLAIEQRSSEVWKTLALVKTEFNRFGDVLVQTKKKLDEASSNIDKASVRTRAMARTLHEVETLPDAEADRLLSQDTHGATLDAEGEDLLPAPPEP